MYIFMNKFLYSCFIFTEQHSSWCDGRRVWSCKLHFTSAAIALLYVPKGMFLLTIVCHLPFWMFFIFIDRSFIRFRLLLLKHYMVYQILMILKLMDVALLVLLVNPLMILQVLQESQIALIYLKKHWNGVILHHLLLTLCVSFINIFFYASFKFGKFC